MTALSRTKSLTIFLVVCYALAITLSSLFHNHGTCESCCPPVYEGGHSEAASCATECSGCCGHHHDHSSDSEKQDASKKEEGPSKEPSARGVPHAHSHGGPCPICSFLAQKTVNSEAPPEVMWTPLQKSQDPGRPFVLALPFLCSWHGRAPPLAS